MTTWTQKNNIKKWVEEKLYDVVEKLLPEGYELGFSASRVSESSYLSINDETGLKGFTIRISDHFKGYGSNDEITILMSHEGIIRKKSEIKKEVIEEVKKNIAIYA
jgi:hypothetical protein